MSEIRTLAPWLRQFFSEHTVTERNLALNTRRSYRDAFTLLLPFISSKARKPVDRLTVRDLTAKRVLQFLSDLEERRGCSVQTRNQRLAAIRAFARFVSSRDPGQVEWYAQIRAITMKKSTPQPVSWLTRTEMDAVLEAANRKTPQGRTEYALLLFLYNTGARVSESTQLVVGNLQVGRRDGRHALVTIHGKGGKIRQCPLWPHTERTLAELVLGRTDDDAVFLSQHRAPYTRFGVYRLVRRCAARVPRLSGRVITPHVVRHTSACHLLQAGVDLNTIRVWLGHANLDTTNIYVEIDLEMKVKAMELCETVEPGPQRSWKNDRRLMKYLKTL